MSVRRALATIVFCVGSIPSVAAIPSASGGDELVNPSLEDALDAASSDSRRWQIGNGAGRPDAAPSEVARDADVHVDGAHALRLRGGPRTGLWHMLTQAVPASAGERLLLTVSGRSRGVLREGRQNANANGFVLFRDAEGRRIGLTPTPLLWGDRDWVDLSVHALVPDGTARAEVGLFLSMTGTAWFDDVRLHRAPATLGDSRARALAFEGLRRHLEQTYPFFGIAGRPGAEGARSVAEFISDGRTKVVAAEGDDACVSAIAAWLADLRDVHVYLRTPAGIVPTFVAPKRPVNFGLESIRARLTPLAGREHQLVGTIAAGEKRIGYVWLPTLQLDEAQVTELLAIVASLASADAMILDVRANGGGNEEVAARVLARWVRRRDVYAKQIVRDASQGGTGGFHPAQERRLPPPRAGGPAVSGLESGGQETGGPDLRPLVVLQGPYCVSSTEGLLAMARALEGVTTVGLPSFGASANPQPWALAPGVDVLVSTWRSLTPDDVCIEGVGIAPDVVVDAPAGAYESGDPTLDRGIERALELLGR